jgi:predicted nucleic acid-binding protein
VDTVGDDEILYFIEEKQLMGSGIGIVDVHLLASAIMTNIPLWTNDKRLKEIAKRLDILYKIS